MTYHLDKILRDIRVCIDQNLSSDTLTLTGDTDTLTLDQILRSKVVEAVRRVHLQAPVYMLEQGHTFGENIYWGTLESGWTLLPDDFLRLVVFQMDDWEQPVYGVITPADPEYQMLHSRFKGIRGTAQRPVCVIGVRPEGRVLEFYSCKTKTAHVSKACYIPTPKIGEDLLVDISPDCYQAVIYMAAALSLMSCGESERATALSELSKTYLEI